MINVEKIERQLDIARMELGKVCDNPKQFTMSIPVRETDTDEVLWRVFDDQADLLEAYKDAIEMAEYYSTAVNGTQFDGQKADVWLENHGSDG